MTRLKKAFFAATFILSLALAGCSGSGDFGYVEGTVTIDGKPVSEATVGFYPSGSRGSVGVTDSEGHYELRYGGTQKGAIIGTHKVTISTALAGSNKVKIEYLDADEAGGNEVARKEVLDESYLDRKTTPLTATVVAGKNPPIDFELNSGEE